MGLLTAFGAALQKLDSPVRCTNEGIMFLLSLHTVLGRHSKVRCKWNGEVQDTDYSVELHSKYSSLVPSIKTPLKCGGHSGFSFVILV